MSLNTQFFKQRHWGIQEVSRNLDLLESESLLTAMPTMKHQQTMATTKQVGLNVPDTLESIFLFDELHS